MAKWQPRVTPETEAALQAIGPYSVPQGGDLLWEPAPGFEWPWGHSNLGFGVDTRAANDADYRRLLDAWTQVCARRETAMWGMAERRFPDLCTDVPYAARRAVLAGAVSTVMPGQGATSAWFGITSRHSDISGE